MKKNYKSVALLAILVLLVTALVWPAIAARGPHYGDSVTAGQVQLSDGTGDWLTMLVGTLASDWTFTFPTTNGDSGQVMVTDGSGAMSFAEKFNQLATNTTASVIEGDAALSPFVFTGDGDLTWDAGYFNAGQTSHVLMAGYIKSDNTGTETIDMTFKIASTEFFGTGALALAVEEEAGSPWIFECEVVGTGTDTQYAIGTFSYMFNGTAIAIVIPFHKTLTETTANALLLSATVEWANGAATLDQATMSIANVSGIDFD